MPDSPPAQQRPPAWPIAAALLVAAVAGGILILTAPDESGRRAAPRGSATTPNSPADPDPSPGARAATAGGANDHDPPSTSGPGETGTPISAAAAGLRAAVDPAAAEGVLETLRERLDALPGEEASGQIRSYLEAKDDVPTGLGFAVGRDGQLEAAPSLRVFLLDHWAMLDLPAAAAYAGKVTETFGSPDEWAVSLRNVARAGAAARPEARTFLRDKTRDLLHHGPWQARPTAGYLEAFDLAVHLGGAELLPDLGELVTRRDNRAVSHAAFLALDRLTINDAAGTLGTLHQHRPLMDGREKTRGNLFARADLRDPAQRAIIEGYLLDPDLPADELKAFAGVFPNANFMVSNNLLTEVVTPDRDAIVDRDRASLAAVNEWLGDPRFAGRGSELRRIKRRLEGFVGAAGGASRTEP